MKKAFHDKNVTRRQSQPSTGARSLVLNLCRPQRFSLSYWNNFSHLYSKLPWNQYEIRNMWFKFLETSSGTSGLGKCVPFKVNKTAFCPSVTQQQTAKLKMGLQIFTRSHNSRAQPQIPMIKGVELNTLLGTSMTRLIMLLRSTKWYASLIFGSTSVYIRTCETHQWRKTKKTKKST